MKKYFLLTISILIFSSLKSQNRKFRPLLWSSHSKNTDIAGVSFGILPKSIFKDTTLTRTFGVKIEVPGIGLLFPLIPSSPISKNRKTFESKMKKVPTEIVYGLNISSGSTYETEINGASLTLIGQYLYKINGVSIAGVGNITERYNGITISGLGNDSYITNGIAIAGIGNSSQIFNGIQIAGFNNTIDFTGLQIGVWNNIDSQNKTFNGLQIGIQNNAGNLKGIQIGLWNKNNKRSLPFINWNFSS
jgi:hypothetical protein